jgi:putative ABC transport system permease protein
MRWMSSGRNVCIIGSDIAEKFFGSNPEAPLEKIININNLPFRVVGVLESKGTTLGMSYDNMVITSYNSVRRFFSLGSSTSFSIQVKVADVKQIDGAIDQAEGVFRPVRRLEVTEADNFNIDKSDTFVNLLLKNLSFITLRALVIGAITLLGAAIGLMNIMLVSVTERTKEIGLVKAIGGRQRNVRQQFLFEIGADQPDRGGFWGGVGGDCGECVFFGAVDGVCGAVGVAAWGDSDL